MAENHRRKSTAAVALICRRQDGEAQWLARWNKHWKCYYFVGGHKRDDETFFDCLVREIKEELGISAEQDFTVAPQPLAHLEYVAWSRSAKAETEYTVEVYGVKPETEYTVEFFDVRFIDDAIRERIQSKQALRWLNEAEIRGQRCSDGLPVSETMARLLDELGWKCPSCQSVAGTPAGKGG